MKDTIEYDAAGNAVSFVGPSAVECFQAAALRSGIGLMLKGIKPQRGWTFKLALARAGQITGSVYNGKKDAERAMSNLHTFVQKRKAELS